MLSHSNVHKSSCLLVGGFVLCGLLSGCGNQYGPSGSSEFDPLFRNIEFEQVTEGNSEPPASPAEISLYNLEGEKVSLGDYIGKKKTVLVITRGNTVPICPLCSTQTSRYVSQYDKFKERDTEVLLIYPIRTEFMSESVETFLAQSQKDHQWDGNQNELPILVDTELTLVDALGIRAKLSKPSTYVFNEAGEVTFAYVGRNPVDRPSIQSVLQQLDSLKP